MSKIITHITGKKLMERWNMDGYDVLQVMKKVNHSPEDWESKNPLSDGSFNTKVGFAELLIAKDIPKDLDIKISSFQFALSRIEEIEKKFNFLPEKQTDPYPKEESQADEGLIKKKLRPNQRAKNKCREVARNLIKRNPTITIAAAIRHEDMIEVLKKKDGSLYLDDTVRGWIKVLWPEKLRKPGRRKGT